MVEVSRRGLITGLGALFICAPAIVRSTSIMPVKALKDIVYYPLPPGEYVMYTEEQVRAYRMNILYKILGRDQHNNVVEEYIHSHGVICP